MLTAVNTLQLHVHFRYAGKMLRHHNCDHVAIINLSTCITEVS